MEKADGARLPVSDDPVERQRVRSGEYLHCPERESTITLSLPSAEYQNKIDIVFVMDSSSSAQNSTVFTESVNELFSSILENNPNLELKVGVIRFRGRAHDAIAYLSDNAYEKLVVYGDDTKDYINQALNMPEADIKKAFGNGSNAHGGIDIADEWLAADTAVDNDHKYVVFLTDGKTYIWNNEANEPTCIYLQQYNNGTSGRWTIQGGGVPQFGQSISTYKDSYPVDVLDPSGKSNIFWFNDYQELYNCTSEELSGVSPWDAFCGYADDKTAIPTGSATKHDVTNGADLFSSKGDFQYYWEYTPDNAWEGVPYLEANPLKVIENDDETYTFDAVKNDDGTYTITEDNINPNYYMYHVDGLMKSSYLTGHLWNEMNSKYNCAVITYSGGGATGFVALRNSFISWLQENSKYGADITASAQVEALFEGIDNSIRYMVAKGVVTDLVNDPFTVKDDDNVNGFKMTKEGTELTGTYESGKWTFADGDYVVEYDASTKTITWTINVPIENTKPITLSYVVVIPEDNGYGRYDANKSAVLDYTTSDGQTGSYTFEVPRIAYLPCIEVSVTKIWDDNDNAAGMRPTEVEVVLKGGLEDFTLKLNEENSWTDTFGHAHDMHVRTGDLTEGAYEVYEYYLEEVTVENYDCVISGDYKTGFIITNTYVPPTTEAPTTEPETTQGQTTPPTGDSTSLLPFAGIFLAAAAVFVVLGSTKTRREEN